MRYTNSTFKLCGLCGTVVRYDFRKQCYVNSETGTVHDHNKRGLERYPADFTLAEPPRIIARIDAQGRLTFYCGYCRKNHYHGHGYGHRLAHCDNPDSPYKRTGYYLVPVGEAAA